MPDEPDVPLDPEVPEFPLVPEVPDEPETVPPTALIIPLPSIVIVVPSGFTPPMVERVEVPRYAVVWNDPSGKFIPVPVNPKFIPVPSIDRISTDPVDPTGTTFIDIRVPWFDPVKFSDA